MGDTFVAVAPPVAMARNFARQHPMEKDAKWQSFVVKGER